MSRKKKTYTNFLFWFRRKQRSHIMNFVKSIWALKPSTSNDSNNNNSTTFTTTSVTRGNSFIITSSVSAAKSNADSRPQHLVFQTSSSFSPEMTVSPTDSFHSASSSTFEQQNEKSGRTNNGFSGSTIEMNNNNNGSHMQSNQQNQWVFFQLILYKSIKFFLSHLLIKMYGICS